jgi:hypothetical protein
MKLVEGLQKNLFRKYRSADLLLPVALFRVIMFPGNSDILDASSSLIHKAAKDAIASGRGLELPIPSGVVLNVLGAALKSPEFATRTVETISLLSQAIATGATSTENITSKAKTITVVYAPAPSRLPISPLPSTRLLVAALFERNTKRNPLQKSRLEDFVPFPATST